MSETAAGKAPSVDLARAEQAPARGAGCLRPGGLELTDRVVDLARLPRRARVLDVGCGSGATVAHLADRGGLTPVGVDASPAQLARARAARPDLDFVAGRAQDLPFAPGSFDAVLAECVLSTLPDASAALSEMVRVLARGGCVVVTDLYDRGDADRPPRSTLPSMGPRETVEALLAGAGLEIETWEDHTGVLARLLWDMTGSAAAPAGDGARAPDASCPRPSRPGRRLGYFACVARARPTGERAGDERRGDERRDDDRRDDKRGEEMRADGHERSVR
jgi:ubiquinone/menaquinone biosynthesis C-methylase UbiE